MCRPVPWLWLFSRSGACVRAGAFTSVSVMTTDDPCLQRSPSSWSGRRPVQDAAAAQLVSAMPRSAPAATLLLLQGTWLSADPGHYADALSQETDPAWGTASRHWDRRSDRSRPGLVVCWRARAWVTAASVRVAACHHARRPVEAGWPALSFQGGRTPWKARLAGLAYWQSRYPARTSPTAGRAEGPAQGR
jgi:hypothetical protein